jgi:NAD(P)-dependent dehydrogenase (short-subunit alcohol dehydrogenase family)
MPFDGSVVIVTGAAGAIGSAAVAPLQSSGATVLAVDRDVEALATLDGVATHVADVTSAQDVAGYVAAAAALGPIGGFFNNAAIEGPVTPPGRP